ncbi:NERD domain-containing protein [Clostridium sp. JS66]|uniref:NERD domain-containing protein n=1 Tax=Clostridium sp. JS66 TaxID=3064705 RepID=UPI00298DEEAD|nr:NERD domain-containing protein [Clostridium sp. JS66]WPC42811.1 NERD domain-containing protein [Clostridium sp. JS66]
MTKNKINPNSLTDDEILEIIRDEYLEIEPTGCWDFFKRRIKSPSLPYLKKRFGLPFNKILIKAGIAEENLNFVRRSNEEYIEIINSLCSKLGHTPSAQEFIDNGYSPAVLNRIFGSYNKAIKECGLKPNRYKSKITLSKTEMLKLYKKLSSEIGKPASEKDINSLCTFSSGVFTMRFNGFNNLRKLAGYEEAVSGEKLHYSKEIITELLINEYYKMKRHLTKEELKNNKSLPSPTTILNYFKTTKLFDVWAEIDRIIVKRETLNKNHMVESGNNSKAEIVKAGKIGENKVSHYLSFLNLNEYIIYNNINIRVNGRSQQIDHLIIGRNGIFHLETKNYSGDIYIDKNENWSKSNKNKYELLDNPVGQIKRHEQLLKEALDNKYEIVSILVMANKNCKLLGLQNTKLNVIKVEKLLDFISSYKETKLSSKELIKVKRTLDKCIGLIDFQVV